MRVGLAAGPALQRGGGASSWRPEGCRDLSTRMAQLSMAFYCYVLECADGTYYTGWTTEPGRRLRQHNRGRGARYTRSRLPVRMVYLEECPDRVTAMKRERAIKALPRRRKDELIR